MIVIFVTMYRRLAKHAGYENCLRQCLNHCFGNPNCYITQAKVLVCLEYYCKQDNFDQDFILDHHGRGHPLLLIQLVHILLLPLGPRP